MSDIISKAIDKIADHETQAAFHSSEALRWKRFVNDHDQLVGAEPRYKLEAEQASASPAPTTVTTVTPTTRFEVGEFLGKPMATAAKAVLSTRYQAAGKPSPATIDEIHAGLLQGSYSFGPGGVDSQKQGIRIALGKNTAVFVKLPFTDLFGLVEWYPGMKRGRQGTRQSQERESAPAIDDGAGEETAAPAAAPNVMD